ncbi:MAG: AAA family ATPase, partial [Candidatus Diapherotrites archaeon]|nr:AAA family ATPase [Candidatus Diapherotrites archaeon]
MSDKKPKQGMSLKVKVNESYPQDVNKSIARLDFEAMDKLGVQQGDILLVKGKQETAVQVWRARFNDAVANGAIKIDGTIRHNAGTSLDETVEVTKAEYKEAKQVVLAPVEAVRFEPNAGNMIKQSRLLDKPLMQGDRVSFDIMGNVFNFVVTSLKPKGVCVISLGSQVSISSVPAKLAGATKLPVVSYEDIGGLDEPIAKIREMVELPLKHPEVFDRLGVGAPKGVLLHGPPGCGKTLLAKAVASECEANFISIAGPEIVSKWYGESEAGLRRLFEQAEKNAPTIIFIDEIDAIAPKREEVTGEVERRIVSQLLTLMDGLSSRGEVIVIGATNRPNSIDEALRRPGRFDREVEINVPDKTSRKEILQIHTRGMPLTQNVDFEKLSEITHGYTGADVNSLCKEAAMKALRKRIPEIKKAGDNRVPTEVLEKMQVSMPDFKSAFKEISPSAMREVLVQNPNVKWGDIGGLAENKQEIKEVVEWPLKHAEAFKRLGIVP